MASAISLPSAMIMIAIVAPIGCSVSVDTNRPMAPSAASITVMYRHTSRTRKTPAPNEIDVPDSVVRGPPPNRIRPSTAARVATSSVATSEKTMIAPNLTASSRVRPAGTASRYRSVPRLASPAIVSAEIAATAMGRKSGSSSASAASAANSPLLVMLAKKSGPPLVESEIFDATLMRIGTVQSTARPTQFRRRPKMSHSSDRNRRVRSDHRRLLSVASSAGACAVAPPSICAVVAPAFDASVTASAAGSVVTRLLCSMVTMPAAHASPVVSVAMLGGVSRLRGSAADIEPLAGQLHEHVFQVGRENPEPGDRYARVHERRRNRLRGDVAEDAGDGVGMGTHLGEAEAYELGFRHVRLGRAD